MTTAPLRAISETDPEPVHVYWIYGDRMEPLYVGITSNMDARLRDHSEKAWWLDVRRIDSRPYPSRDAAREAEAGEIKRLTPKWNVVHNRPERRPRKAAVPRVNTGGRRQLISLSDAAEYLCVSERSIRRYISTGRLTGYRAGPRLVRLDMAELDAMLSPIPTATWSGQ